MTNSYEGLRKAMLRVAEDPNRPGFVDEERLEQYLLSVEGKVTNGMKFVSTMGANGKRRWHVEKCK